MLSYSLGSKGRLLQSCRQDTQTARPACPQAAVLGWVKVCFRWLKGNCWPCKLFTDTVFSKFCLRILKQQNALSETGIYVFERPANLPHRLQAKEKCSLSVQLAFCRARLTVCRMLPAEGRVQGRAQRAIDWQLLFWGRATPKAPPPWRRLPGSGPAWDNNKPRRSTMSRRCPGGGGGLPPPPAKASEAARRRRPETGNEKQRGLNTK